MRTSATTTISLPPGMLREIERARKIEHRTRSELIREAIRAYLATPRPVMTLEDYLELRDPRVRAHIAASTREHRAGNAPKWMHESRVTQSHA